MLKCTGMQAELHRSRWTEVDDRQAELKGKPQTQTYKWVDRYSKTGKQPDQQTILLVHTLYVVDTSKGKCGARPTSD